MRPAGFVLKLLKVERSDTEKVIFERNETMYTLATIHDTPGAESRIHFSAFLVKKKIGSVTLVMRHTGTHYTARLSDVTIIESAQGRGYCAKLTAHVLEFLDEYAAHTRAPINVESFKAYP